jgi:adenosylmethionine-8-amino-7-oxononanoate aminotransferase
MRNGSRESWTVTLHPPGSVIGFVAETVVGATLGAVLPVPGYFRKIREVCDRHGILLILCGMGRTGTPFACEQEGVVPDIVTIAKGLGAGYQPIGAMIASDRIYDAIVEGSGFFQCWNGRKQWEGVHQPGASCRYSCVGA